jgi:ABC-type amino acid transport substrate-binding protein
MIIFIIARVCSLSIGLFPEFPLMDCNTTAYSGFIPDLTNKILQNFGYNTSSVDFICMDSSEIVPALKNSSIDIAALTINPTTYDLFNVSQPIMNNGLAIVGKNLNQSIYWLVFQPFSNSVWCLIMVVPGIIGLITWLLESSKSSSMDYNYKQDLVKYTWNAYLSLFLLGKEDMKKIPARIVMSTYWFVYLMLTAAYISNLSSRLDMPITYQELKTYYDIKDKAIGTYEDYTEMLQSYNITFKLYQHDHNYIEILNDIDSGAIDAGLFPYSAALYMTSSSCEYSIGGNIVVNQYLGFGFSKTLSSNFKQEFIISAQGMNDDLTLQSLINQYFLIAHHQQCNNKIPLPLPVDLATGVCVMLGGGVFIALPLFLMFRKQFIKIPKTEIDEKKDLDLLNMMIKFDCVLGCSKNCFIEKINELKEAVQESSRIGNKYEDVLRKLSIRLEGI